MTKHIRALGQTALVVSAGLIADSAAAQSPPATWTQVGMLTCKRNPSIGFVIFSHPAMGRFAQNAPLSAGGL